MKILVLTLLLFTFNTHAMRLKKAPRVIAQKIAMEFDRVQTAFANVEAPSLNPDQNNEIYYLKRIRLMYAPFVAFDVWFFELKIIPMIEFRWTRKNPAGWTNYKPTVN